MNRRILPRHVDGRTRAAKRLIGLAHDLSAKLDAPDDPVTRSRVMAAALLIMQQESMAHAVADGKHVDPDDVVRITHATARALEKLGLGK